MHESRFDKVGSKPDVQINLMWVTAWSDDEKKKRTSKEGGKEMHTGSSGSWKRMLGGKSSIDRLSVTYGPPSDLYV